ncbi:MAG TPA: RIP metalloprotease RseP [Gammaproteobacteria bacterium]|nr:RIP metalloprotease RseP [Gammaproteobacteria bacterium]
MLNLVVSIVGIFITLLLIIGIHELGHFLAARLLGVKVLRFSIGFGKALWSRFDQKGTEYVIAAIPLGGYVKMLEEDNENKLSQNELKHTFSRQPFYKKFIVIIAGPLANLILAFVLYWILFVVGFTSIAPIIGKVTRNSIAASAGVPPNTEIISIDGIPTSSWMGVMIRIMSRTGDTNTLQMKLKPIHQGAAEIYELDLGNWHMDDLKPDPLESLGLEAYEPEIPAIIEEITTGSPAAKAGLKKDDKILALNGKKINNWIELASEIDQHPSENLTLNIQRKGKIFAISVMPDYHRDFLFKKHGFLGISPQFKWPENLLRNNQYGPIAALSRAWQNTYDFTDLNLAIMGKLLTGKMSIQSLGGPLSIFQSAGTALNQGITPFLSFLAFISISIGIINVFPIPGLDGGHLLFQTIEAILRRPIPPVVQEFCYRLGLVVLLLLIFQSIINDVLRFQ